MLTVMLTVIMIACLSGCGATDVSHQRTPLQADDTLFFEKRADALKQAQQSLQSPHLVEMTISVANLGPVFSYVFEDSDQEFWAVYFTKKNRWSSYPEPIKKSKAHLDDSNNNIGDKAIASIINKQLGQECAEHYEAIFDQEQTWTVITKCNKQNHMIVINAQTGSFQVEK